MDSIPSDSSHSTKGDILRYVSDELSKVDFEIPSQEISDSLAGSPGQIFEWGGWPVHISVERFPIASTVLFAQATLPLPNFAIDALFLSCCK